MGRKRAISWRGRIAAAIVLVAMVGGGWVWWQAQHWTPSREEFPAQGALIGARDAGIDFKALRAVGASFVYLEASDGVNARDAEFARYFPLAKDSGLRVGVVHSYDPCIAAERQAANFLTIVPRDASLLPPAISLSRTAEACSDPAAEAAVESELTTFLNQIEGHTGQPAVLLLSPGFEQRYHVASRMDRGLWVQGDWYQPDYAGRPWSLWTANSALRTEASSNPVRWVVVQP